MRSAAPGEDPGMEQPGEILTHSGPDLELRRRHPGDADVIHPVVMDSLEHLRPWMPWVAGYDYDSAVENAERCDLEWRTGEAYHYAVVTEGQVVGCCSMMRRTGPGGLEIGYWISRRWTRRGLGRAAAATLLREAFTLPGVDHVEIHHDEANAPSGAIPRGLGFTRVGARERDEPLCPGESGVTVVWRMTRAQYLASRQPTRTTTADSGGR